jgi:hypothetical protein
MLFNTTLQEIRKQAMSKIRSDENLETPEGQNRILKVIRYILASYGFDGNGWKNSLILAAKCE